MFGNFYDVLTDRGGCLILFILPIIHLPLEWTDSVNHRYRIHKSWSWVHDSLILTPSSLHTF